MALIDDFKAKFPNDFTDAEVVDNWNNLDPEYSYFYPADLEIPLEKSAALYYIAHLLYIILQTSKSSIRLAASKSVHDVSVSYTANSPTSDLKEFLGTTKYGQLFLQLTSKFIGSVFV